MPERDLGQISKMRSVINDDIESFGGQFCKRPRLKSGVFLRTLKHVDTLFIRDRRSVW